MEKSEDGQSEVPLTNLITTNTPPADKQVDFQSKEITHNQYATMKTVAQGMLDMALLTANSSQLKSVLQDKKHPFYTLLVFLIAVSIALQVSVGICVIYIGSLDIKKEKCGGRADKLNKLITAQIFIITVVNLFISSFWMDNSGHYGVHLAQEEIKRNVSVL